MIFRETPLTGAFIVEVERHEDERGFFARSFCREEFARHGIDAEVAQCNVSYNAQRGTLRGLHWQREPHQEGRLVRCTAGAIFDAIVDLRPESPTFTHALSVVLSAEERNQVWVPKGFAHGFLTLAAGCEVSYQMSVPYAPGHDAGYRYDDPTFAIPWPEQVRVVSERDLALPHFSVGG